MKKQGVSAVVATVLIVLITVSAVAIVWSTIIPMITDSLESTTGEKANLQIVTNQGYTVYDPITEILKVQVSRGPDSLNIENMEIQVTIGGETIEPIIVLAPEPGQTKTYQISLVDYGIPTSVSIAYKEIEKETYSASSETSQINQGDQQPEGIVVSPGSTNELSQEVLDSLVAHWVFDWDDGVTAIDSSGNGNNGVYKGDATNLYGTLVLDGDGDYVSISNPSYLDFGYGDFSISLWLNHSSLPNGWYDTLISSGNGGGYPKWETGWAIIKLGSSQPSSAQNSISFIIGKGDGSYFSLSSTTKIVDSNWYHIVCVADRDGLAKIYINGDLDNSVVISSSIVNLIAPSGISIGSNVGGTFYTTGSIDNLMAFDKALTETEIEQLFSLGN